VKAQAGRSRDWIRLSAKNPGEVWDGGKLYKGGEVCIKVIRIAVEVEEKKAHPPLNNFPSRTLNNSGQCRNLAQK